jgi:multiple sugar transport system substrate-binding protein
MEVAQVQRRDNIVSGDAAMTYVWSNQLVALSAAAGEGRNFLLVPMPRPEGGASTNYLKPSMFFSITSQAKNPDAAAMFIDFFTNDIEANKILMAERGGMVSSGAEALQPSLMCAAADSTIADIESSVARSCRPMWPAMPMMNNVYWPLVMTLLLWPAEPEDTVRILREQRMPVESAAQ